MKELNEFQVFACFYIIGIIIAFVFDFFKALRKEIRHKDFIVWIEDIIYLLFSGILIFIGIFKINQGILRFYIVLAIILRDTRIFFDNRKILCYNFHCNN